MKEWEGAFQGVSNFSTTVVNSTGRANMHCMISTNAQEHDLCFLTAPNFKRDVRRSQSIVSHILKPLQNNTCILLLFPARSTRYIWQIGSAHKGERKTPAPERAAVHPSPSLTHAWRICFRPAEDRYPQKAEVYYIGCILNTFCRGSNRVRCCFQGQCCPVHILGDGHRAHSYPQTRRC